MEKHQYLALLITGLPKLLSFLFPLGNSKAVIPMEPEETENVKGKEKGEQETGKPTSTSTSTRVKREMKRRSFEDTQRRVGKVLFILRVALCIFVALHVTSLIWNVGWGWSKSSNEANEYYKRNQTQFKTCTANGWYSPKADITPAQGLLCDSSKEYINDATYSIFWNTWDYAIENHCNCGWFSIETLLAKLTYVTIKSLVSIAFLVGIVVTGYLILSFMNEYILRRNEASLTPVELNYDIPGNSEVTTNNNKPDKPREIMTNPKPSATSKITATPVSTKKERTVGKKDD
jgi:hypothetical protein